MPDKKPLRISSAFGPTRDRTLLLTAHPDEQHDEFGDPVPNRRTLILALNGDRATFVDEHPMPLVRSWYSTTSGVAYCTSVATNKLYKWESGKWSEEVFSESPIDFVRFIFGFGGAKPEDDEVFLSTQNGLFIRTQNIWKRHALNGERFAYQIHGRDPSRVFIGGTTLFVWDGKDLEDLESPEDDTISALWVTKDGRLAGGNTYLSITRDDGGWDRIPTATKDFGMLMEFQGSLYATTSDAGVIRLLPSPAIPVTSPFEFDWLVNVGDALVAVGDDLSLVGDGTAWQQIQVPGCEVGQRP